MGDHKKLSGAQFRKRAKEKQAKVDDLLAQTPKLNTYFTVPSKATSGQTDNKNESDSIAPVHAKSDDVENTPSCSTSDLNVSKNQDSEKLNVDSDPAKWVINDAMRDILFYLLASNKMTKVVSAQNANIQTVSGIFRDPFSLEHWLMVKKDLGHGWFFQKVKVLFIVLHVDFSVRHQLWQKIIALRQY